MRSWTCVVALVFVCSLGLLVGPGIAESRITDVSADASGCGIALNDNGTIWLWGTVSYNDDTGLQPVIMPGIDHVKSIGGDLGPVILKDDGTVWLIRNYPMFENTTKFNNWPNTMPEKVDGLSDIVAIDGSQSAGYGDDLIALKKDGTVWTMGSNSHGQRGTSDGFGNNNWQSKAVDQVAGLTDIKAVSMGDAHALAVKNDGTVWSWGFNNMGQLGDGTVAHDPHNDGGQTSPVQVKELTNVTSVAAGMEFSMALKDDGTVWTWGRNTFGQLGDGVPGNVEDYSTTPVQVKGLTNVIAISAGRWYALALRDDGTVWAWGDNRIYGTLGDGTLDNKNVPVQVKGLSGIVAISAGSTNCYALDKYGVVWGWGDDSAGQLGDGQHGMNVYRATADKVHFTEALAGPAIELPGMNKSSPQAPITAPAAVDNSIEYMSYVDGTIYSFTKNSLTTMDNNGMAKWNITIPGRWTYEKGYNLIVDPHTKSISTSYVNGVTTTMEDENSTTCTAVKTVPIFTANGGYVYAYVLSDAADAAFQPMESLHVINQTAKLVGKDLIAVSPNGTIEWTRHFTDDVAVQDNSHVEAHGGRVYLYHDYNETVLDSSGNLLFTIENISNPPSLDEDGNIYAVRAAKETRTWLSTFVDGVYYDYRTPSNLIEAFAPDGTLKWTKELDRKVAYTYFFPVMWNGKIGIPLYVDGRLYVPQDNGTTALSKDGSVTWKKDFGEEYGLFYLMPTDTKGDIYLYRRNNDGGQNILVVRPDGTTLPAADLGQAILVSASEGLLFEDNKPFSEWYKNTTPDNLETGEVAAMDLLSGKYIWNFTTPLGQPTTVIVNKSNIVTLFPDYWAMGRVPGGIQHGNSSLQIVPAENMTYVYFRTSSHEDPVVYGQSSCTYYSALYAIDRSGKLVWQKPMDLFVTAAAANNTTIYYGTSGGGISVATIGAVAGVAIVGSLLAFFLFGSVTRARSKIDKNDNRNRINKFIADRPGSTLYEISKELGMNIGTLRYHLMILGLNHRIVTYNDEGKFVRYFTNSNTYSDDDKMVISLLRRESMGRLLKAVLDSGEITNSELCVKLGLPESGISKYLSELSDKGVVTKTGQGTRMYFSIREIHRDRLSKALAMVDNTGAIVKAEEVSSDQVGA